MKKTNIIVWVAVIIIIIIGGYFFMRGPSTLPSDQSQSPTIDTTGNNPGVTGTQNSAETVIGTSASGNKIIAYHFLPVATSSVGSINQKEILFVGGIHGGYEWNTVLVAGELMNYLKANPEVIPNNVRVSIIPVLNPDGLNKVVGTTTASFTKADVSSSGDVQTSGRFNGNNVDLNRNFDCDWQTSATWQNKTVSGGTTVFSEPESQAIKNYIETNKPAAVLVWYSAAGGVFASNCHNGVSTETNAITKVYASASGYPAFESFDFYATTGDMTNWLAKSGIPAISVLLTNHTDTEWTKNLAGVKALLNYYKK